MQILIVTGEAALGSIWARHLERAGMHVDLVASQVDAIAVLERELVKVIILNLDLEQGSAIAVADYAGYKRPDAKVISISNSSFFSDGSVFGLLSNVCAQIESTTPPEDVVVMVDHFGGTEPS